MGIFSRFEGHVEDGLEGAANKMFDAPISPVQIAKKAEKAMRREKMVGAGRQYAPTLYTILVNPDDDQRLFGYYPTLAGETETYLAAKANENGLVMDGQPLVRFIVDEELRHGKFDVIAEMVSAPIISQLRQEEMARYGLAGGPQMGGFAPQQAYAPQRGPQMGYDAPYQQQQAYAPAGGGYATEAPMAQPPHKEPLPYVPEEEIDRSIDYGEYTFNSQDFENYEENGAAYTPSAQGREGYGRRTSQPLDPAYAGGFPEEDQFAGFGAPARPTPAPAPARPQPMQAPATRTFNDASPAAAVYPARLVNTATGRTYALTVSRMVMGRSSGCGIVVDDINASRSHAEFTCDGNGVWTITDLGSTNGTYVNGQRITSQPLYEGDRISLGMTDLMFTQN